MGHEPREERLHSNERHEVFNSQRNPVYSFPPHPDDRSGYPPVGQESLALGDTTEYVNRLRSRGTQREFP